MRYRHDFYVSHGFNIDDHNTELLIVNINHLDFCTLKCILVPKAFNTKIWFPITELKDKRDVNNPR